MNVSAPFRHLKMLLLVSFALLLAGCASSPLTPEQRSAYRRISIAKVEMPEKPTIFGENAGAAFLLTGPIGLAIANGTSDLPTEFKKSLARSNTDVGAIFREDLERKLKARGFEIAAEGDPKVDAVVVAKVHQYGLTGNILSTPPLRFPQLSVGVELRRPGATDAVWSRNAALNIEEKIFRQLDARPIADYLSDPLLLNTQVRKASDLMADEVLSKL